MAEANTPIRYMIVGRGRSGTTLVHLLLIGHPNVAALNDELKHSPFFTHGFSTFTFGNDLCDEQRVGPRRLFDALTGVRQDQNTYALGAKTVFNSPAVAARVVRVLRQRFPDIKVVHVIRNDIVALYGSAEQAKKSGIMHSWYSGQNEREVHPLRIRRLPFTSFVLDALRSTSIIQELGESHEYHEISFESYLERSHEIQTNLMNFLGLPQVAITWLRSQKVLPPAKSYIGNYSQATVWLEGLRNGVEQANISPMLERAARVAVRVNRMGLKWKRQLNAR